MISFLTLNVSAPTAARARELLGWLWHQDDDVWVLSETSSGAGSRLIAQVCRAAGFGVQVSDHEAGGGLGVMVVVRDPAALVSAEEGELPPVLPGRVLPLQVGWDGAGVASGGDVAGGVGWGGDVAVGGPAGTVAGLRVLGVYGAASDPVRYSSAAQRARKREWIAAFDSWLPTWVRMAELPVVVLGDLNLVDPLHRGELPYVLAEETALVQALGVEHGLVDAFRHAHPRSREVSWVDHSGAGCRYDHAFVSAELAAAVVSCDLVHEPRTTGLTDHSALRLVLGR